MTAGATRRTHPPHRGSSRKLELSGGVFFCILYWVGSVPAINLNKYRKSFLNVDLRESRKGGQGRRLAGRPQLAPIRVHHPLSRREYWSQDHIPVRQVGRGGRGLAGPFRGPCPTPHSTPLGRGCSGWGRLVENLRFSRLGTSLRPFQLVRKPTAIAVPMLFPSRSIGRITD